MPKNLGSVTKYFSRVYENSAPMTLGATVVAPGAGTIQVNGMTNYVDGDVVVFVVDPGNAALKQVFTGTKSGSNIINAIWTEGTDGTHSAGAAVIDYVAATDWDMLQLGLLKSLNQDGSLVPAAVQTALGVTAATTTGWQPLGYTIATVTALGNRSYSCVINGNDVTGILSPGMRLLMPRTVAAPHQCTSLNGSSQYFNKTSPAGMTFTDDFTVSAWIKLSSYATGVIVSRYNGTSGWYMLVNASGQLQLAGFNASSSNFSSVLSNQAVPLNRWVHVAAQLDMSTFTATPTTSYTMIDGLDVPAAVSRGGTNPTALIQAGNLEIGSNNGGSTFFPGKIAQVVIYNAKVTQATILTRISQTMAGNETSVISAYTLANSVTDLNANANNLTAQGSATTTTADSPFAQAATAGSLEYGIVTNATFSTNTTLTVQVPEGSAIPSSGGVGTVSFSPGGIPFGFPGLDKFKLSAYDTSGTLTVPLMTTMVRYVTDHPLDMLPYLAPGGAGGTYYLSVKGAEKQFIGVTSVQSISGTGALQGTAVAITLPVNFFSTIQSVSTSVGTVPSGTSAVFSTFQSQTGVTSVSVILNQATGSNGAAGISITLTGS